MKRQVNRGKVTTVVAGSRIGHDVKRQRVVDIVADDPQVIANTQNLISSIEAFFPADAWRTVRGVPPNKRRATIHMTGPPGTGKTLMQSILTRGMQKAYVDVTAESFPLASCQGAEVIVWEEGKINIQQQDMIKKVFEGRDYPINRKGRDSTVQTDWTPVVVTSNSRRLLEALSSEERAPLYERMYRINIARPWFNLTGVMLERVDMDVVAASLDKKWLTLIN